MTQAEGKSPKPLIDRWFPHKVTLSAEAVSGSARHIAEFFNRHKIGWQDQHTRSRRDDDSDYYVYSFADEKVAVSFQMLFGGDLSVVAGKS